jgi:ankyrin repeat protein
MRLIDAQDNDGKTPLHLAVENRRLAMVEMLLRYNPDQTLRDRQGCTPLQLAIRTHQTEMVRLLTKAVSMVVVQPDTTINIGIPDLKEHEILFEEEEKEHNAEGSDQQSNKHSIKERIANYRRSRAMLRQG